MSSRIIALKKEVEKNKQLYDELFVSDSGYRLISSSPKVFSAIHPEDFTENFYISEEELNYYVDGFIKAVTDNVAKVKEAVIKEDSTIENLDSGLDDFDVKLSLYRSFKSLYDKWISNSETPNGVTNGYFYNNYGGDDDRMLYEHFKFINRANQDVGKKAVIDFSYLSNLANSQNGQGPTQSLYESLTGILSENNFDFWPLPANINLSTQSMSDEDIKDMFRPLNFVKDLQPGPTFVCVYIGGSSRSLADLDSSKGNVCISNNNTFNYTDDSFDITQTTDWPNEYKSSNDGIVAFRVRYGQEAQNYFDSVELDQTEFKETQESLKIIDAMSNPNSGTNPSKIGKGNNMYDVYLTRSYNCTVSGLGNMSIQPLMYFKLENVPMFRGTYLIMGVKHTITPHNIKTEFTGMRQPRVTVPVVTEALSLLDIALTEISPSGGNTQSQSNLGGSGGQNPNLDNPENSTPIPASASLKEVLKKAGYNEGTFVYEMALVIGTKEGYKKGSTNRPSRNNNPGNLAWSQSEFSQLDPNATIEPPNSDGEQRFAKFSTPELGAKALVEKKIINWGQGKYPGTKVNGCKQGNYDYRKEYNVPDSLACIAGKGVKLTIEQFIYIYAPPSDNNTERYINQVVNTLKKYYPQITRTSKIIDYINQ